MSFYRINIFMTKLFYFKLEKIHDIVFMLTCQDLISPFFVLIQIHGKSVTLVNI